MQKAGRVVERVKLIVTKEQPNFETVLAIVQKADLIVITTTQFVAITH